MDFGLYHDPVTLYQQSDSSQILPESIVYQTTMEQKELESWLNSYIDNQTIAVSLVNSSEHIISMLRHLHFTFSAVFSQPSLVFFA